MNIGINGLQLGNNYAGLGRYARNLLGNIARIDHKNEYYLFLRKDNQKIYEVNQENFHTIVYDVLSRNRVKRFLLEQLSIPKVSESKGVHILFSPGPVLILRGKCKKVFCLHDVRKLLFPMMLKPVDRFYYKIMIRKSLKNADMVFTVSNYSKMDIIRHFHHPEEKIVVTYDAVDENFRRVEQREELRKIREKYKIQDDYILFVGEIMKIKNPLRIIQAYAEISKRICKKLVLAGRPGNAFNEARALVNRLGIEKDVLFLGWVPDEDLRLLYSSADLFVFPSLYEGFGMPVLEAMACGVPVITSNTSCLPEIGGDAAVYVNPEDIEDISRAILEVHQNKGLQRELVEKGYKQVKLFSWEKTAEHTLKHLERLGENVRN